MKKTLLKKIISIALAVLMLSLSIPTAFAAVSAEEIADGYEYGAVLVSLQSGSASAISELLADYEIESIRLITPGASTMAVYYVKFVEKTKEIVWQVIEVLKADSRVKYAEPNYIGDYLPVKEPTIYPAQPTEATEPETEPGNPDDGTFLYLDRLYAHYDFLPEAERLNAYEEPYYHYDAEGNIDWAIVYVSYPQFTWTVCVYGVLGGKSVYMPGPEAPFTTGYGVYDVAKDEFIDVFDMLGERETVFDRYDGLYEAFSSIDISRISPEMQLGGGRRGDADGDRGVDIFDVTLSQRFLADLVSRYSIAADNADTDDDGTVSIFDVTLTQRYLAQMCNIDGSVPYTTAD